MLQGAAGTDHRAEEEAARKGGREGTGAGSGSVVGGRGADESAGAVHGLCNV